MELMIFSGGRRRGIPTFKWCLITVWLSLWIQRSSAQGSGLDVVTATVGETVTLTAPLDTASIHSFSWYRGPGVNKTLNIFTFFLTGSKQTNGSEFTGRETGLVDGSMQITDVLTNYTGKYTVNLILNVESPLQGTRELRVYEVLSAPILVKISGSFMDGNDVTLNCMHGNETVERYEYFKDHQNITCNQRRLTCSDNRPILEFRPITMSDSGNYTCRTYNPVSSNSSAPLGITVQAAPISNVTLSSNQTLGRLWENEDSVQLNCSARGTEPVYTWEFNGSPLPPDTRYHLSEKNSSLTISPVKRTDLGPFVCTASNSAGSEKSNALNLSIAWRPNGTIQCGAQNISENEVMLSCSWPDGNPPAFVELLLLPGINQTGNNKVTHTTNRSDITANMTLNCNGNQENHTNECSLSLDVPSVPGFIDNTTYTAIIGQPLSLTVNLRSGSSSRASTADPLPATFTWFKGPSPINGSDPRVNITSSAFSSHMVIDNATESDSSDYLCQTTNLMGTTTFTFFVNVQPPVSPTTPTTTTTTSPPVPGPPDPPGLSVGAIVGIVVGVVAVLVIIGVTVYCVLKKKKAKKMAARAGAGASTYANMSKKLNAGGDPNTMQMRETQIPQADEINYAVLKFKNNQPPVMMPAADYPGASETVYAHVKKP